MKFKTSFKAITLDTAAYSRVLLKYLRGLNSKAGTAWIDTAVNKTPIPTWSGASRATFSKLALELGTSVTIGPIRSKKNRTGLGAASSNSRVIEQMQDGYIGFMYETSLRYLAYNEYNAAVAGPPPQPFTNNVRFTPYHFQGRAEQAWQKVADKARLPNPYKHLKKRKI
jgi:hypothetical protein